MDSERQRGWRDGDSMKGGGWAGVWGKKEVRRDLHGLLEVKMLAESPLPPFPPPHSLCSFLPPTPTSAAFQCNHGTSLSVHFPVVVRKYSDKGNFRGNGSCSSA